MMIAFKDGKDGYYQCAWDGVSPTPEWTNGLTQIEVPPKDPAEIAAEEKERHNAPIKTQLAALDMKRIRPIAEGDTAHLAALNASIEALRATLKP